MYRVLVVEDNDKIRLELCDFLSKNELRIMHCLFQNRNTIVSREKLMQHMWDCDVFVDDNTLTVNINRLRKKLEYVGLSDFIETRRGQGYIVYENQ